MEVEIIQGDILTADTEVIVNSANSLGTMSHGVAAAIKQAGGEEIEVAAEDHSPCSVGNAYATPAGSLPFKAIVHAPTMEHPDEPIPAKQVELATVAALRCADEAGYTSIALPLLGTGYGDVDVHEASRIIVETVQMYMVDDQLERAVIYAYTPKQYAALQEYV